MNNKTQKRLHTPRFQALLVAGVLLAGMGLAATASATPILSASTGGVPVGADAYETFNNVPLGNGTFVTNSGITVSFVPDAQVVTGAQNSRYAPPFLSGGNGVSFGGQPDGADTTHYITSGSYGNQAGAAATLTFPGQERYMGLLWGSVDPFNRLTFFNGTTQLTQFTGMDVTGLANGNQGAAGTFYVNINFSTPFTSVVATSSSYAFEFDNVAFSTHPIGVPEPGVTGTFLLGLLLLGLGYWFKRREQRLG